MGVKVESTPTCSCERPSSCDVRASMDASQHDGSLIEAIKFVTNPEEGVSYIDGGISMFLDDSENLSGDLACLSKTQLFQPNPIDTLIQTYEPSDAPDFGLPTIKEEDDTYSAFYTEEPIFHDLLRPSNDQCLDDEWTVFEESPALQPDWCSGPGIEAFCSSGSPSGSDIVSSPLLSNSSEDMKFTLTSESGEEQNYTYVPQACSQEEIDAVDDVLEECVLDNLDKKPNVTTQSAPAKKRRRRTAQIWQFLLETLEDDRYNPHYIQWLDREQGTFKFIKSQKVAQLWGARRKREMTYEHLSRAMRYYYKAGVMLSVPGQRLTYGFGDNATGWKSMLKC